MKYLRIFKLTKPKRIVIFIAAIIVSLLTIILGSIFYASPKTVLGSEYNTSAQYLIKVNDVGVSNPNKRDLAIKVANDIKGRIDGDANHDVKTQAEVTVDQDAIVRVTYPNVLSDSQKQEISNLIQNKPNLVFTDYYGNALFNSEGAFNKADLTVGKDPGKAITKPEDVNWNIDSKAPIKNEGVEDIYETKPILKVNWRNDDAEKQWTDVTDYVSKLPDEEKKVIVAWIDLNQFINMAKVDWPKEWEKANGNPYFFAFVDEKPVDENKKPNKLKEFQFNAPRYLVSDSIKPKESSHGKFMYLQRPIDTSSSDLKHLVRQINYGTASYDLDILSSRFIAPEYSKHSFQLFLLAIMIIFALLTLFLVFNYGIMGIISSLAIALFTFLTWTFVTFLGGVFTPIVVGALIFAIAFFVDKNIVFFEKIKQGLYQGSSVQKTLHIASRKSTAIIFDTHIISLIMAIALFYFGSVSMWGFSLTLVVGVVASLFILFIFTKMLVLILLNTNIFDNRPRWLGLKQSTIKNQSIISSPNFVGKSCYAFYGSLAVIGIALIVMVIFMLINFSFSAGLNLSQTFSGGSLIEIGSNSGPMTQSQVQSIIEMLKNNGVNVYEIEQIVNNNDVALVDLIRVAVNRDLDLSAINLAIDGTIFSAYLSTVLSIVGQTLIISSLASAAIALLFIVLYVLFRFKWTFSLTILLAVLFDLTIVISMFIMMHLSFNFQFIIGLLLVLIYSLSNNIIIFGQIKERTLVHVKTLNRQENIKIANLAATSIIKRLFYSTLMFVCLFILLMLFMNIVSLSLVLCLIFGVLINVISTIFIGPSLWVKLETYRQKRIDKRVKTKYWDVNHPEEQTFNGINNYKV